MISGSFLEGTSKQKAEATIQVNVYVYMQLWSTRDCSKKKKEANAWSGPKNGKKFGMSWACVRDWTLQGCTENEQGPVYARLSSYIIEIGFCPKRTGKGC